MEYTDNEKAWKESSILSCSLNECPVDVSTRIAAAEGCSDTLQSLLSESSPRSLSSHNVKFDEVAKAVPALDSAFPIMHTHNLQLTDLIPHQVASTDEPKLEARNLLRPSVRLLARIGKMHKFFK